MKRAVLLSSAATWVVAIASGCADPNITDPRVEQGLVIAPVDLDLNGRDQAQVGLGSYLVNAATACNDCHTAPPFTPGGDPFQGEPEQINTANYLAGGVCFGTILAPNITPDEQGLPAGLELEEFIQLMRTGRDPEEPGEILQVMPWPIYGKLSDQDLTAIYTYLQSIPSAAPGNTVCPPPAP